MNDMYVLMVLGFGFSACVGEVVALVARNPRDRIVGMLAMTPFVAAMIRVAILGA